MIASVEALACAQLEGTYRAFVVLINDILTIYTKALEILRNFIKQVEVFVYNRIMEQVDLLKKRTEELLALPQTAKEIKDAACDLLLACEPLVLGYTTVGEDRLVTDPLTGDRISPYEFFKRYACGSGIQDFLDTAYTKLKDSIDASLEQLKSVLGIDSLEQMILDKITDYENFIKRPINDIVPLNLFKNTFEALFPWAKNGYGFDAETANIFDLIDFMDVFVGCAFAACNLAESAMNKKADMTKKLSISTSSRTYQPGKLETKMLSSSQNIRDTISGIQNQIDQLA